MADTETLPNTALLEGLRDAQSPALLLQAWEQCYLNPPLARAIGMLLTERGGIHAAAGWVHVALTDTRLSDRPLASRSLLHARRASAAAGDALWLALCDEVEAIGMRRDGNSPAAAALYRDLDARTGFERTPIVRFIGHNARAINCRILNQTDQALRHFYAACEAANATGWAGPRATALTNLGGCHQDLYNLEDARSLCEEGLAAAREAGVAMSIRSAACNLTVIHYALGEHAKAQAVAELLVTLEPEMLPGALAKSGVALAVGHLCAGDPAAGLLRLQAENAHLASSTSSAAARAWARARCLLALGRAADARQAAELLVSEGDAASSRQPLYDRVQLLSVLSDACEATGDLGAALAAMRAAHALYAQLVGRSARARFIALEVSHQLGQAKLERDQAIDSRRSVEDDRQRLAELNAALQAQIAQTDMLHTQLREQALNDPLTGLHNRRYLYEAAPGVLDLARRQNLCVCVVLIDLDHFKLINDTYGHQAGDFVLQRFSSLLRLMLRRSDLVCRYGGEEFVAVMPHIDGDNAQAMLARLQEALQTLPPEPGRRRTPNGSFSAGIALFPHHGSTLEQLLSRADKALYAAKNLGRARIEQVPRTGFGTLN